MGMPTSVRQLLFCRWNLLIPDSWAHSFNISVQIGKRLVMYFGHQMLFWPHTLGGICYNPKLHHTCLPGIRPTHYPSLPKPCWKTLLKTPFLKKHPLAGPLQPAGPASRPTTTRGGPASRPTTARGYLTKKKIREVSAGTRGFLSVN